jgi:hypothetical protein
MVAAEEAGSVVWDEHSTANEGEYLLADDVWRPADSERFTQRACDAVYLSYSAAIGKRLSLEFLRELPGLRRVALDGPLKDDTLVFELPRLAGLSLRTRCRKPLRLDGTPELDTLDVPDRPGLATVAALTALRHCTIGKFTGADLAFLGAKPVLEDLRVEGRKASVSLDAVAEAPALRSLEAIDVMVPSLWPLAPLKGLRELVIAPNTDSVPHDPLDLTPVASLPDLHTLRISQPVASLAPLAGARGLRRLVVGRVADGDLTPLLTAPPEVVVSVIDDADHHSHRSREIDRLRGTGH